VAATAVELGLPEALAGETTDAAGLAARLGLEARGVTVLLGALEAMGAVRAEPDGWRLTGPARARLVDRDTPDYEADSLQHWLRNVRRWADDLPDLVRRGRPETADGPARGARTGHDLARFMAAMANKSPSSVELVAQAVRAAAPDARTLLDLGGGPGSYARGLAARGFRVTLLDRPEVIEHVSQRYGLGEMEDVELAAGDFLEALPEGRWDVVFLANVTHIYGPETNADILRRAAGRLAPGGRLAILDFVRGVSSFAPLFAVTMLLATEEGGTWTLAEYDEWLRAAGLAHVRCASVTEEVQLVTARAPVGGPEAAP
jgi:2-polyprenyl-3-methyl-5-hydroxy-6-metoxy-1,4-benzoquinol methylase